MKGGGGEKFWYERRLQEILLKLTLHPLPTDTSPTPKSHDGSQPAVKPKKPIPRPQEGLKPNEPKELFLEVEHLQL